MIRAVLFDPSSGQLQDGGLELVDAWDSNPSSSIWVVLENEGTEDEAKLLSDRFGIHQLAIADAFRDRHPPKIEPFEHNTFILLKGLDADPSSLALDTIQLSLFVGERFLVTRSTGHSMSSAKVMADLLSGAIPPDITRGALALRVCRAVADRFLPQLFAVEKRLEEMEGELLHASSDDLLNELVQQKGELKRLLRTLQYHAQVFTAAKTNLPTELAGHEHELFDVQEQFDRLLSLARLHYELTDDLMTGYLSLSAHRLNQIMQTLTIVTVIFVPITFMAGVYGMNFEFMPELGFRGAYFILLTAMLVVVGGVLAALYRRGWLGSQAQNARD